MFTKTFIIYDYKTPNLIRNKDIAIVIDKTKKWIISVMPINPKLWNFSKENPKDIIHLSRRGNPTELKHINEIV